MDEWEGLFLWGLERVVAHRWFFLALLAAIFISASTLLEKETLLEARSLEVTLMLVFTNALMAIPFFFFVDFSRVDATVLGTIFLGTLFGTGALFLATKSLKHTAVSE